MEGKSSEVVGILVTLKIGEMQSLFIVLHADGTIHRMGSGCEDEPEHGLFSGRISPEVFHALRAEITPELLAWCGQARSDPAPQGRTCELLIGLKCADGSEQTTAWEYGTDSQSPPLEVCDFVYAAVQKTDPWYEEQLNLAAQNDPRV